MTPPASKPRRRARPAAKSAPVQQDDTTIRDLLAPLAALAMETSVKAYAWGLKRRQLMRASLVVDLCCEVAERAYRLSDHTAGPATKEAS